MATRSNIHNVQHQMFVLEPEGKAKGYSNSLCVCLCLLSLSFPLFLLEYDWLLLDLLSMLVSLPRLELRSWPPRARTVAGGVSTLAAV